MVSDQATRLWRCAADHSRDKPHWLGLLATSVLPERDAGLQRPDVSSTRATRRTSLRPPLLVLLIVVFSLYLYSLPAS
jgi:hypothetical protein